jgi:hypothetical protein
MPLTSQSLILLLMVVSVHEFVIPQTGDIIFLVVVHFPLIFESELYF